MGKIEKCENTFFSYFLWVFLKLKSYKSVKIVLKRKFKNTSNHQNYTLMESKNRLEMTVGWVLRKLKKKFIFYLFFVRFESLFVHFEFLKHPNKITEIFF